MAGRPLDQACLSNCLLERLLQDGFIYVVSSFLSRSRIPPAVLPRENPLPAPFRRCVGVLPLVTVLGFCSLSHTIPLQELRGQFLLLGRGVVLPLPFSHSSSGSPAGKPIASAIPSVRWGASSGNCLGVLLTLPHDPVARATRFRKTQRKPYPEPCVFFGELLFISVDKREIRVLSIARSIHIEEPERRSSVLLA